MDFKFHRGSFLVKTFIFVNYCKMTGSATFLPASVHRTNFFEDISVKPKNKHEMLEKIISSEISEFLVQDSLFHLGPFFKSRTNCKINYSFVVDSSVAKNIANKILPDVTKEKSIVVEGNPGLGLLTNCLLKSGVPKIQIFEQSNLKVVSLNQLTKKYQDRLEIQSSNIFQRVYHDSNLANIMDSALKINKVHKIVGVVPNYSFFSTLVISLLYRNSWQGIHLTEFYVVVSTEVLKNISKFKSGKYLIYCMFNFIYEFEILDEYPRTAFLPLSKNYEEKMYLLKICKKPNCFDDIGKDSLDMYVMFLRIVGRSRFNFIIETLEKWIPECGPYLISKGIAITTQTQDLSASESVKLFSLIKKWEGYNGFKFLNYNFNNNIIKGSQYKVSEEIKL